MAAPSRTATPGGTVELAADIGGTFTDVVLESHGQRYSSKVLTTHEAPERGVLQAIQRVLDQSGVEAGSVQRFVHGTTLATNALIERRGAPTALITTRGFRDSLEIAYEHRFAQYDLAMRRPRPLVPREWRFEADERCAADGTLLASPSPAEIEALARQLRSAEIRSVAIVFLHAFTNPANEQLTRETLQHIAPELSICVSHEVCPEIREYERLCTTVANAYVRPVMRRYLARLEEALQHSLGLQVPMMLMTSGGGLTDARTAQQFPVRLVESGPAGGVIMANQVAQSHGVNDLIAFDMGGTTAKLCLVADGKPEESRLFEVAREYRFQKGSGIPIRIPVIEMVEIGAGGGSIARVDAMQRIVVGPESAGSQPGPACYGQGAHPTVTDADLLLGRIDPHDFGDGQMQLNTDAAERAIAREVAEPLGLATPLAAVGISEMVNEAMASAARVHGIERGLELADRVLVATGGAAPLHAARLAQKLGLPRVIIPRDAGVGSAIGFLRAPLRYAIARSRYLRLDDWNSAEVAQFLTEWSEEASERLRPMAGGRAIHWQWWVDARYVGQGHELQLELPQPLPAHDAIAALRQRFEAVYQAHYHRLIPDQPIECLNWLVVATVEAPADSDGPAEATRPAHATTNPPPPTALTQRPLRDPASGEVLPANVYRRHDLLPHQGAAGPALIVEPQTTTVVPPGFRFHCAANGDLILERHP